jgi:hypothetical protein
LHREERIPGTAEAEEAVRVEAASLMLNNEMPGGLTRTSSNVFSSTVVQVMDTNE